MYIHVHSLCEAAFVAEQKLSSPRCSSVWLCKSACIFVMLRIGRPTTRTPTKASDKLRQSLRVSYMVVCVFFFMLSSFRHTKRTSLLPVVNDDRIYLNIPMNLLPVRCPSNKRSLVPSGLRSTCIPRPACEIRCEIVLSSSSSSSRCRNVRQSVRRQVSFPRLKALNASTLASVRPTHICI